MRILVLFTLMILSAPAAADFLDDSPYGPLGSSWRRIDEMEADWPINPPPTDADEATLRSYFNQVEERDEARRRLQKDAEFRLRKLEERQEEFEDEMERRELLQPWP